MSRIKPGPEPVPDDPDVTVPIEYKVPAGTKIDERMGKIIAIWFVGVVMLICTSGAIFLVAEIWKDIFA